MAKAQASQHHVNPIFNPWNLTTQCITATFAYVVAVNITQINLISSNFSHWFWCSQRVFIGALEQSKYQFNAVVKMGTGLPAAPFIVQSHSTVATWCLVKHVHPAYRNQRWHQSNLSLLRPPPKWII